MKLIKYIASAQTCTSMEGAFGFPKAASDPSTRPPIDADIGELELEDIHDWLQQQGYLPQHLRQLHRIGNSSSFQGVFGSTDNEVCWANFMFHTPSCMRVLFLGEQQREALK